MPIDHRPGPDGRHREEVLAQIGAAYRHEAVDRPPVLIGDANYLDVLSAIQSQQRLQREVLSARLDLVLIRIGLYLALAGDFDTRPQFTDSPSDPTDIPAEVLEPPPGLESLPPPQDPAPEIVFDD